jgi:hypothetical protein
MEKQTNNSRSERTPAPLELFVSNKNSLLLSQLQVNNQGNNQSMQDKSATTPGSKYPRH